MAPRLVATALLLGVLGASLFYGDSVITPAISVLSAVEGLEVASPGLKNAVLPIGIVILGLLFLVQRFGTHAVGRFFGPIMVLWFLVLAATGLPEIVRHPDVPLVVHATVATVIATQAVISARSRCHGRQCVSTPCRT